jgi:hypothetical protein
MMMMMKMTSDKYQGTIEIERRHHKKKEDEKEN